MVHKRKYRIISLILAAVMLLAGTYLDHVTEELFALRGCGKSPLLYSRSFQTDINDVAACTTEILNEYRGTEQQSMKLNPQRFLLCCDRVLLFTGKSYRYPETVRSLGKAPRELVMDYMHQSDGKKRD